MAKVLIVDHQKSVRKSLTGFLGRHSHEAKETSDGKEAIEIVSKSRIDLVLLDIELPGMDGYQVLASLKENPRTNAVPVIMLTSLMSVDIESKSLKLGASNVLAKPCDANSLATLIRIGLREGEEAVRAGFRPAGDYEEETGLAQLLEEDKSDWDALGKHTKQPSKLINTDYKLPRLEAALEEGLPVGGLALMEGPSESGKSVICQYLMYGAVLDGWEAALFTSGKGVEDLGEQMKSLGLELAGGILEDKVTFHTIARPSTEETPAVLIDRLVSEIEVLPESCGLVIIDGITDIAFLCDDREVMGLFSTFTRLSSAGRAIIVVAQSAAFEQSLLSRLHQLCNSHIRMSNDSVRGKPVKNLNVTKINNVEKGSGNGFYFNVEPDFGVNIVPVSSVKL